MNFKELFFRIFKGYTREVEPSEKLSRFLTHKKHVRSDGKVHPTAFEPDVRQNPHQLSVFRVDGLIDSHIWNIGKKVCAKNKWTLYGRADITALHILDKKLTIKPDNKPKGHANIIDWPDKAAWKLLIKQLADESDTVLFK